MLAPFFVLLNIFYNLESKLYIMTGQESLIREKIHEVEALRKDRIKLISKIQKLEKRVEILERDFEKIQKQEIELITQLNN